MSVSPAPAPQSESGRRAAVLVGHSFGTLVAMGFAIDRPGRVSGLALLNGFRTLAGNPGIERAAQVDEAGSTL